MNPYFGFLFARPSFLEGIARVLDLGGTLQEYNSSVSEQQADALAIGADWHVVGEDLLRAMEQLGEENELLISEGLLCEAQSALNKSDQLELSL
jgi:hypothetical protein